MRRQPRVDGGQLLDLAVDLAQEAHDRVLVVVEEPVGVARQLGQAAGARLDLFFLAQCFFFARGEIRPLDLRGLVVEHLPPALGLPPIAPQRLELRLDLAQPPERTAEGFRVVGETGMAVEHGDVGLRIEQALRLVLAVDGGEPRGQLAQYAHGHESAVDGGLALSGAVDLPSQDDLFAVDGQTMRFDGSRRAGAFEDRLHDRALLAGPDQLGRGARAEEKAQRVDQDRLSRARLAREKAQPGAELQLQLGDDRYVIDPEQLEHRGGPCRAG